LSAFIVGVDEVELPQDVKIRVESKMAVNGSRKAFLVFFIFIRIPLS
jgi:hypothetical protein